MTKICVLGTGYVGLVTGAVFADLGNRVICVDKDEGKIQDLVNGIMPIYEPGLKELVERNRDRLTFTTDGDTAVGVSNIVFICVGTPPGPNGEADMSQVDSAAQMIARSMKGNLIVVNKSTVPIGTGDRVAALIEQYREPGTNHNISVVSNPEFLREGSAISDSFNPDRVVVGSDDEDAAVAIAMLYKPLNCEVIQTDIMSAEMIKYAANAFLATKISFINSIAELCTRSGADIEEVSRGIGSDKRIGQAFLHAGIGYGGSCFPKDVKALIKTGEKYDYPLSMLLAVEQINFMAPHYAILRLLSLLPPSPTIAVLGLAFKPNTDDIRASKALEIIEILRRHDADVRVYDPVAMDAAAKVMPPSVTFAVSPYHAAQNADAVFLATEWNEFKHLNMEELLRAMKGNTFFDGRNVYDPQYMRDLGFNYLSIGRK